MNLLDKSSRLAALAGALAFLAAAQPAAAQNEAAPADPAQATAAQDVSESHLAAARATVAALGSTDQFDEILPASAQALKNQLIQSNPDLQSDIIAVVDQVAFTLAGRRGDLEREAALAHARVFSEEELTSIAQFYESDAGKKLLTEGPIVMREVFRAAEIWQAGIQRDMTQMVNEEMVKRHGPAVQVDPDELTPGQEAAPEE